MVDAPALEIDVSSLIWIDGQRLVDHIRYHKEGKSRFRRDEPQQASHAKRITNSPFKQGRRPVCCHDVASDSKAVSGDI